VSSALALDTKHKPSIEERVREGSRYHPFRQPLKDKFVPWDRGYWRDLKLDFDKETAIFIASSYGKKENCGNFSAKAVPSPPLYGHWWYWGENCPFSPFE